jgi:hypothetical protein
LLKDVVGEFLNFRAGKRSVILIGMIKNGLRGFSGQTRRLLTVRNGDPVD